MAERCPCEGVINRIRQIGNRRGWIVIGDDDATTITSGPDEPVEWPLLLRRGDRVTIIRANPARKARLY